MFNLDRYVKESFPDVQTSGDERIVRQFDRRHLGNGGRFKGKPIKERLWSRVRKTHGCWFWLGARNGPNGYGQISYQGRLRVVHQVVWELNHRRQVPRGKQICHSCDNPICVRDEHFFVGTQTDNMLDAARKRRLSQYRNPGARRGKNHWTWRRKHAIQL